jgi:GDP-L-fucose synthase
MIKDEVLESFRGKNVLVTGGSGLIGRQIVDLLISGGAYVKIVSMDRIKVNDKAQHIYGDLRSFDFCGEVTRGMDYVFHVAGIKGSIDVTLRKPASFLVPLLMFNTNVLEACRINRVRKVVFTSSIGAYSSGEIFREGESREGPPMDMFPGWAKRMAELQIRAYQVQYGLDNFAIVRPANVYGPGDNFDPENAMVIPTLMYRIYRQENPVIIWGNGESVRDFAYSRDVAEGVLLALYHGTKSDFVNLGSGKGTTIRELVETLRRFIDFKYEFDETKPSGFPRRVMDISLARKMIEYNPTTSLQEGLERTWKWFTENQSEYLKRKNYFVE